MATRGEELNFRVSADTRQAISDIDDVQDSVEKLEDSEHVAKVSADTDAAERQIRTVDDRLDKLTSEERRVLLELQARDAQRDIDQLNRDLARAEKFGDAEIQMRVEARGNAQARLDAIQSQIREIDGASPRVRPEVDSSQIDALLAKLDDLGGGRGAAAASQLGIALRSPAGVAAALTVGLVAAGEAAADAALQAGDLSRLTGDSVEFASQLNQVWKRTGADVKDLQDVLLQMGGVIADDEELVRQLGINIDDGRTLGERFVQVVELLGTKFDDAGERSVVASRLFGEEGVRQVNAVIARVGDLSTAINEIEPPFDADAVARATEYKEQVAETKENLAELGYILGSTVLPGVNLFASAMNAAFRDASELGLQLGRGIRSIFDGGEAQRNREVAESVAAAEQAARSFDRALLENATSVEEVRGIVQRYGLDLHTVNLIVAEWARAHDIATSATGDLAAAAADSRPAYEIINSEIDRAISNFHRFGADGVEQMGDVATAAGETADAISEVDQALADARGEIDDQEAWLNLQDSLARVRESYREMGDTSEKTADQIASDKRRHERDLLGLERSVLSLIERYDDIPPEKVTQLRAFIDAGNIDAVEYVLAELTRDRYTRVIAEIQARQTSGFNSVTFQVGGAQRPTVTSVDRTPAPVPQQIDARQNTIIYPQGTTPTEIYVNGEVFVQRNGLRVR